MGNLFEDKRVLVLGVANKRSLAWGISRALHAGGARLGFTYLNDAIERRVRPLAETVDADLVAPCDVGDEDQVRDVFEQVRDVWGGLDVLVHSIAFADRDDLKGRFVDTSRDGFLHAMEISAYSLISLARHAAPLLSESDGSILTMTYYGAEKAVPGYNVMGVAKAALEANVRYLAADLGRDGVRVNAISAGPVKTLAAAGIGGLRKMLKNAEDRSPLQRNVTQEDIGRAAVFLCSDLGAGVTGEVVHVDAGYSIMGM